MNNPVQRLPATPTGQAQWHYSLGQGERHGPFPPETLLQYVRSGQLPSTCWVWREGMSQWKAMNQVPEFQNALQTGPYVPWRPQSADYQPAAPQRQSPAKSAQVVAIIGLCTSILPQVGIGVSIAAMIMAIKARKVDPTSQANNALVLSIIGIALSAIIGAAFIGVAMMA